MPHIRSRRLRGAAILTLSAAALAACGTPDPAPAADDPTTSTRPAAEQRAATPRLVATYDGGLLVLDAATLKPVADLPLDGFNRVNPLGDDRHVAVSTAGGFRVLDVGTWGEPHGDHAHHFTADPVLTGMTVEAEKPGHVVVHDGLTAFFDDGTGRVTVVDAARAADPATERRTLESEHAHHGVAVAAADGTVVSTLGDDEARVGLYARDADGTETARTEECPGIHGEAAARDALVFGCTDGVVVYSDGGFHKIDAPDAYGRIGNQAGSPASPVVLGDYKVDEDAELERPRRVTLVDTERRSLRLVDLPSSYSFRSLGRGPDGEALVLGTDGQLHVIDPGTARIVRSVDVVEPWTEPTEWKQARPTLYVRGGTAYVTEPSARRLVAVDIRTGRTTAEATLPHATDELTGVGGEATGGAGGSAHGH